MSVETKIIITCNRCRTKSTPDNYKQFCSKVNLPSVEHFNNFEIDVYRHMDKTLVHGFGMYIKINDNADLCPKCHRWVKDFFEEELDKIKKLLGQKW